MIGPPPLFLLLLVISGASHAASAFSGNAKTMNQDKPNIFFIMTDQHRFDMISAYHHQRAPDSSSKTEEKGNDVVLTPNLDSLARDGVLFRNAYSSTPTCTPARAAVLTGLGPWQHGMLGYGEVADRYPWEYVTALRNTGGYHTVSIGKNHFGWTTPTVPRAHNFSDHLLYDGIGTGLPPEGGSHAQPGPDTEAPDLVKGKEEERDLHSKKGVAERLKSSKRTTANAILRSTGSGEPFEVEDAYANWLIQYEDHEGSFPSSLVGAPGEPDGEIQNPFDDYDRWFQTQFPGQDPLKNSAHLNWNTWAGNAYEYPEYAHPTAWVGQEALTFLDMVFNASHGDPADDGGRWRDAAGVGSSRAAGSSSASSIVQLGDDKKPLFMKISFHRPHSPYDPPARLFNRSAAVDPPMRGGNWNDTARWGPDRAPWNRLNGSQASCGPQDPNAWCGDMGREQELNSKRAYQAQIRFVDEWIGRILQKMKGLDVYEDALILFASDHGDAQGDHYLWRKGYPIEGSAHVPMILKWPPKLGGSGPLGSPPPPRVVPRGTQLDQVVELRDLAPTFAAVAGISPYDPTCTKCGESRGERALKEHGGTTAAQADEKSDAGRGHNLLCTLLVPSENRAVQRMGGPRYDEDWFSSCYDTDRDREARTVKKWRDFIDLEHTICYNRTNHWNALTDGQYKYIYNADSGEEMLFDLTTDRYEMLDLKAKNTSLVVFWRQRLIEHFVDEGRGDEWVAANPQTGQMELKIRQRLDIYSPNYPGAPAAKFSSGLDSVPQILI